MEVSQFELIWKPQSPTPPTGGSISRVLQGYFLEITNLENKAYSYAVSFVAAPVSDPTRSLAGNTLVFVDVPNINNTAGVLQGNLNSTFFSPSTGLITVPANGTALIAVVPSAFGVTPFDPTPLPSPNFEVRGHVRLTLPALLTPSAGGVFALFQKQSNVPVKVLLTAQNRATYFNASGAVDGQTQATLITASGKALNEIPPEPPFIFNPIEVMLPERFGTALKNLEINPPEAVEDIMAQLSLLSSEKADLSEFNKGLAKLGIGLAVERRKI